MEQEVNPSNYEKMVRKLKKPGADILDNVSADKLDLLHMGILLSEEGAEVLGVIKKHVIYGQALDMAKLINELGDAVFALYGLMEILGVNLNEIKMVNMMKLGKRYPDATYTDTAAIERVDTKEENE